MSQDAVFDRITEALPALLNVAEVAHELVGVSSHVNCSGAEYAERKLLYAKLRDFLGRLTR